MPKKGVRETISKSSNRVAGSRRPIQSNRFAQSQFNGLLGFSAFAADDSKPDVDVINQTPLDTELEADLRKLGKKNAISRIKALESIHAYLESKPDAVDQLYNFWPKVLNRLCMDPDSIVRAELCRNTELILSLGGDGVPSRFKDAIIADVLVCTGDPFVQTHITAMNSMRSHGLAERLSNAPSEILSKLWTRVVEAATSMTKIDEENPLSITLHALSNALELLKDADKLAGADILRVLQSPVYADLFTHCRKDLLTSRRLVSLTTILAEGAKKVPKKVYMTLVNKMNSVHTEEWIALLQNLVHIDPTAWESVNFEMHVAPVLKKLKTCSALTVFADILRAKCLSGGESALIFSNNASKIHIHVCDSMKKDAALCEAGLAVVSNLADDDEWKNSLSEQRWEFVEKLLNSVLFESGAHVPAHQIEFHLIKLKARDKIINIIEKAISKVFDSQTDVEETRINTTYSIIVIDLLNEFSYSKLSQYLNEKLAHKSPAQIQICRTLEESHFDEDF